MKRVLTLPLRFPLTLIVLVSMAALTVATIGGCHRHDRPKEKEIIHEVEREVVKPHRH